MAHQALRRLTRDLHAKAPFARNLAQQVPRADNSAADAAANFALDIGDFHRVSFIALQGLASQLVAEGGNSNCGIM
eukprot:6211282-Karenia_brevis.AAC.1